MFVDHWLLEDCDEETAGEDEEAAALDEEAAGDVDSEDDM